MFFKIHLTATHLSFVSCISSGRDYHIASPGAPRRNDFRTIFINSQKMQSTHQPHERAPEAEEMHGPEIVTSRAPRELPAVNIANLSIPICHVRRLNYISRMLA